MSRQLPGPSRSLGTPQRRIQPIPIPRIGNVRVELQNLFTRRERPQRTVADLEEEYNRYYRRLEHSEEQIQHLSELVAEKRSELQNLTKQWDGEIAELKKERQGLKQRIKQANGVYERLMEEIRQEAEEEMNGTEGGMSARNFIEGLISTAPSTSRMESKTKSASVVAKTKRVSRSKQSGESGTVKQTLQKMKLGRSGIDDGRKNHGKIQADDKACMCGQRFNFKADLQRHLNKKLKGAIKCDFPGCKAECLLKRDMAQHKKKAHGGYNQFLCEPCKTFFSSKAELEIHRKQNKNICKRFRIKYDEPYKSIREQEWTIELS